MSIHEHDAFFVDFADVLERTSSFAGCILVGDVNVHLDKATDVHALRFISLLDDFGLQEHVRTPTHKKGHQLDVFITRTNQPVSTIRVDPPLMSDHSLIVASIDVISR